MNYKIVAVGVSNLFDDKSVKQLKEILNRFGGENEYSISFVNYEPNNQFLYREGDTPDAIMKRALETNPDCIVFDSMGIGPDLPDLFSEFLNLCGKVRKERGLVIYTAWKISDKYGGQIRKNEIPLVPRFELKELTKTVHEELSRFD